MTELASAPPRRRREDWAQSRTLLSMVRVLMARPTGDEVAQQLVLNLLRSHQAKSAVISLFGVDGALHAVGAFGIPAASLDVFTSMSLWDASPMADCIRENDTIMLGTADEVDARYPWLGTRGRPSEALAAAPLALMNQQVGAVQVTFAQPPDESTLYADLAGLTAVLALYLSLIRGNGPAHRPAVHEVDGAGEHRAQLEQSGPVLTLRQEEILRLMAGGLTNPQIAKHIGFSESTVRQETMAIYRELGVSGRRAAIRLAAARGMLGVQAVG